MKPTSKEAGDRRKAERRTPPTERRADAARGVAGDRRAMEGRGVGAAMVDALEDILQWERASERSLKVADKASSPKLSN
ncbi:MAG: hypothetical protein KF850_11330 [Labilithrix sp.]|nr:hypothetical protein [Labilithrix sp.]MBX3212616.1 hypothetical protein [Labilithrix sp.]